MWGRGQRGNNAVPLIISSPLSNQLSRVRLGVSPTTATPTVVHSQLGVSVFHSASSTPMVRRLASGSLHPPVLPVWLFWLTVSFIFWLSEFHAVWFSGTSGCLLILDWLLSSFWLCKEAKGFYLCLHLGWNFITHNLKDEKAGTWLGGSVDWSIITCTKRLWVWFPTKAHT